MFKLEYHVHLINWVLTGSFAKKFNAAFVQLHLAERYSDTNQGINRVYHKLHNLQ